MKRLATLALIGFCAAGAALRADPPNEDKPLIQTNDRPALTDAEKRAGWKLLFDGVSTRGWRGLGRDDFPADRWVVQDGCLRCLGDEHAKPGAKPDDIIPVDKYENFELSFEWMIPKPKGNSGVKYRVQEQKGEGFAFGPEYQCMNDDDAETKDATGSLYDVLPPKGKKLLPPGQFNHSRIIIHGNHAEHWLNGVKVVEYEWGSEALKAAVARSKFKNRPDWGRDSRGYIALQDHHDEIWFRNLKIRETKGE